MSHILPTQNLSLCFYFCTSFVKMPLTREVEKINNVHFFKPMRAIFSGSSQSGKTHLIGRILQMQEIIFGDKFAEIKYFYPEYLDECPVDWHKFLDTPISYESGFPNKEDILKMQPNSLLVIDDNMKKIVQSELMRQFFNVISGKKNISIIAVTQNYFTQGSFSRDIRNSSNYVCLFRNCADAKLNLRVSRAFGLEKAYDAAEKEIFQNNVYPYVFIDQTQRAQLSGYRLYINILDRIKVAFNLSGMKGYILSERDFLKVYTVINEKLKSVTVVENEDTSQKLPREKSRTKISRKRRKLKKKRLNFDTIDD